MSKESTIIGNYRLNKTKLAIATVWLFQISASLGILLGKSEWFLSKTPYTLLLYSIISIWIFPFGQKGFAIRAFLLMIIGFVSEWLGVNHWPIFGEYHYGENFGYQVDGTPLIIGLNWMVLALVSKSIASKFFQAKLSSAIVAALLMVLLDIAMEFVADIFGFWHFQGGMPPLKNYISWFVIGLLMQLIMINYHLRERFKFSIHYYVVNLCFFSFFAIYYNL